MNLRSPQTFIRINVADAAQNALIQQQRFDLPIPRTDARDKLLSANQQRIGPKYRQLLREPRPGEIRHPSKSARIRVAQLPPIIKLKPHMRMLRRSLRRGTRRKLPRHSQMYEQG